MIHVVNKRTNTIHSNDSNVSYFFIGRGSPLGNKYSHKTGTKAEHVVASREEAISLCELDIKERIEQKHKPTCDELNNIYRAAKRGDVYLVCYCAPLPCHGDVIKRIIEAKLKQQENQSNLGSVNVLHALWFSGEWATFMVEYDHEAIVRNAPPIARWTIGKKLDQVVGFYQGKGFDVKALSTTPCK